MKPVWIIYIVLLCGACSAAFAAPSPKTPADSKQHVVLLSLDGFRHDYIEKHQANNLADIARQGVRAQTMIPVYPANTFPNHISLVTGLHPSQHGIVNNYFYDKQRPKDDGYAMYGMGKGLKDSTWIQALPLWNLVEFHGDKAATFFWPESDARINGALPTYHYHYSKYSDYQQRIDQIIAWLSLPESSRPRFVAGYFSLTDSVGHDFGPDAKETFNAVQRVDALVGQLYRRLQALPIAVNLVVVSDHGMTNVDMNKVVTVESLEIPEDFVYENEGAQVMIYARPGVGATRIAQETARLANHAQGRFIVLDKQQREQRHYSQGPRTGDIVLEISAPARFVSEDSEHVSAGGHGYLPEHPDMGATFVAAGPAFKKGETLPSMSSLEVYPGIAQIMELPLLSDVASDGTIFAQGLK
ncbi:alkaline phosphatase family protein [Alteromonas sp. H39]|uniref:alkaline phosphatase family protein n=1 Tax=Alteromonas sp. H39 TaxID=3389876 RepID=UPI0039DFFE87